MGKLALVRLIAILFLAAAGLRPATAPGKISLDEYHSRRAALRRSLDDGVLLLRGTAAAYDPVFRFQQDTNFYYLTGWAEPGAVLLMTHSSEILFLPRHDSRAERYSGRHTSAEDSDARAATGFDSVLPIERLESELDRALSANAKIYAPWSESYAGQLRARYPFRDVADATPLIARLRVKKSEAEIAAIQHATDVSIDAHRAAWKRLATATFEYQLSAVFLDTFLDQGCEGPAYSPIVGAGADGAILHYMTAGRRMERGELVVMDAAAECQSYASDITRTVPVGGKFSPRQRQLYEVVLGAQKAAIAAVKPESTLAGDGESLTKIARDYMDAHGKDLHGAPLGKYFTHDIGHQVGLDVHDPPSDGPLEAGMVITIEPGVYIPEEKLGLRIEDVVLVTPTGARVLSAALPKEPEEIEKALSN